MQWSSPPIMSGLSCGKVVGLLAAEYATSSSERFDPPTPAELALKEQISGTFSWFFRQVDAWHTGFFFYRAPQLRWTQWSWFWCRRDVRFCRHYKRGWIWLREWGRYKRKQEVSVCWLLRIGIWWRNDWWHEHFPCWFIQCKPFDKREAPRVSDAREEVASGGLLAQWKAQSLETGDCA
jgi:hypothetical protein